MLILYNYKKGVSLNLALKYRPKRFEEIIGQEVVVRTLMNALEKKRIANAYLFSGLRGSGKTTTARIFAKALECDKGPTPFPCEECENCKLANENRHMDIIEMDAASNRRIEDIRELIEHTKYRPFGRYKIFIIDEVHMLTNEAFNALLKTLEEPPEYVKFILATTDPLKLPATILSRVQHFRFNKIPDETIEAFLQKILVKEEISFEPEAIRLIVKSASGSVRDALTLLDQAIAYSNFNVTLDKVVEMLGVINPQKVEEIFDAIMREDRKKIKEIVKEIKNYDIESILQEIILYLKERLFRGDLPLISMQRFFNIIADAKELIKYQNDNEFVLGLMFFRMIEALKPHKIDDMIKELECRIDKKEINGEMLFKKLLEEVKKRDEELGICFETSVKFISFDGKVLKWESCPDSDCKGLFRRYFSSVIRPLINDIFGVGIKIDVIRCEEKKPVANSKILTPTLNEEDKLIRKVREVFGSDVEITKLI